MSDTPKVDAFLRAENCTRDNLVAFDWLVGLARSLEREAANSYKVYQACNDDLIKCDEEVMRWFKAASPYATPGSLEEGLKKLREELIEECALICESRAGEGQYAESQAAWRILISAAHAIRALKNFQPDSIRTRRVGADTGAAETTFGLAGRELTAFMEDGVDRDTLEWLVEQSPEHMAQTLLHAGRIQYADREYWVRLITALKSARPEGGRSARYKDALETISMHSCSCSPYQHTDSEEPLCASCLAREALGKSLPQYSGETK